MRTQLSSSHVEQYQRDGFLVLEGFLDASELTQWRATTEDAVQQRLEASRGSYDWGKNLTNQGDPNEFYAQVFTQCLRLADTHAGMRALMLDPRLGEIAATLAGVDGIRIWHDQALFKPPYGNPTSWHLDVPYWSFSSRDAISIWVALDDATLENGCLWYLPGTHQQARYDSVPIGASIGDLFKHYPEWLQIKAVPTPAKAGDAVFHNGLTAHGAGANMTPGSRRAMACGYMPDGAKFNGQRNILPQEYFESLHEGDVLNNDEQNPLIWSRAASQSPVAASSG